MTEEKPDGPESPAKRWLEAAAALIGGLLAIATLGIIIWDGLEGEDAPPFVLVESRGVHADEAGFVLEVRATNRGDRAAAQVVVEGELKRGEESVATSETTFDYVPSRSHRDGGLFFAEDPRGFAVLLRAKGYVDP